MSKVNLYISMWNSPGYIWSGKYQAGVKYPCLGCLKITEEEIQGVVPIDGQNLILKGAFCCPENPQSIRISWKL